jgi:hypothetical protein
MKWKASSYLNRNRSLMKLGNGIEIAWLNGVRRVISDSMNLKVWASLSNLWWLVFSVIYPLRGVIQEDWSSINKRRRFNRLFRVLSSARNKTYCTLSCYVYLPLKLNLGLKVYYVANNPCNFNLDVFFCLNPDFLYIDFNLRYAEIQNVNVIVTRFFSDFDQSLLRLSHQNKRLTAAMIVLQRIRIKGSRRPWSFYRGWLAVRYMKSILKGLRHFIIIKIFFFMYTVH